ncbi:60s ribosomal protein l31, partial [Moniliophthora roreri]
MVTPLGAQSSRTGNSGRFFTDSVTNRSTSCSPSSNTDNLQIGAFTRVAAGTGPIFTRTTHGTFHQGINRYYYKIRDSSLVKCQKSFTKIFKYDIPSGVRRHYAWFKLCKSQLETRTTLLVSKLHLT